MRALPKLTDRQAAVLTFIREYTGRNGYPPTLREIGERLGIASTNGVNDHLEALVKKGRIVRTPSVSRGLRVLRVRGAA